MSTPTGNGPENPHSAPAGNPTGQPQYPGMPQGAPYPQNQYPQNQYPGAAPAPEKQKNTLGLISLIVAVIGFIFACVPGALIVGWILLPIAFVMGLVSLFLKGKKQGFGLAAVIVSVVGTVVGVLVFVFAVGSAIDDAVDEISSGTDVSVSEPGDDSSGSNEGTRENPYPLGSTVTTDDWAVTVNSVDFNANEAVAAENQFNDPAAEGTTYILANVTVAYQGESDAGEMPWTTVDYVTVDGNTISSGGAVAPDALDTVSDLYQGGSTSGNILFAVPADSAADGVLAVSPDMFSENAFVAVQ